MGMSFSLNKLALLGAISLFGVIALPSSSQALIWDDGLSAIAKFSTPQDSFLQITSKDEEKLKTKPKSKSKSKLKADGEVAQKFIAKMGDKAISFLSDEKLSQKQKEKEFRKLLTHHFDMETIGRFAMGRNWKVTTAKQKIEYQKLFKQLIVKVYTVRFNDYEGQNFDVVSVRDRGKKDVLVTTHIVPDAGSKIKVEWRVRNRAGKYKIIDVVIEGVSMSLTQRSDFSSVIQRGGGKVEVLLEHLRK